VLESLTRFVQELRRDADIVLGGTNVNVAQIRGQLREQSLHVGAGSIPRDEPMLDGCVSNIVDARLAMRPSFALDSGELANATKEFFDDCTLPSSARAYGKECRCFTGRQGQLSASAASIGSEFTRQLRAGGDQARFKELGIVHGHERVIQVDIVHGER